METLTLPTQQKQDEVYFTEIGNILYVFCNEKTFIYTLENKEYKVNKDQINLPEGLYLKYPDGSTFYHKGQYALIRNWRMKDGSMRDRIAIPWSNLYM